MTNGTIATDPIYYFVCIALAGQVQAKQINLGYCTVNINIEKTSKYGIIYANKIVRKDRNFKIFFPMLL